MLFVVLCCLFIVILPISLSGSLCFKSALAAFMWDLVSDWKSRLCFDEVNGDANK